MLRRISGRQLYPHRLSEKLKQIEAQPVVGKAAQQEKTFTFENAN